MRRFLIIIIAIFATLSSSFAQDGNDAQKAAAEAAAALMQTPKAEQKAQKPNYWKNSVQFDIGFNQTSLTNWAAGGYNTMVLNSSIDAKAGYERDLLKWNNRLQLKYSFLWSADKKNLLQKSNDLIYLESRLAYKAAKDSKWNYSVSFDLRSQFSDSYDKYKLNEQTNQWEGTLKSGFISPAYANIALGMEWEPADWFSANIAPLTGGFTICTIPSLRKKYGMRLRDPQLDGSLDSHYRSALFQFGAQIKMNFNTSINDNLRYETQLVLFTDYLNKPFTYTRINWDNKMSVMVAKYFKISFSTWLIYDPIVIIDGRQRMQFKEFFEIGFSYTIKNY